MIKCGECPMSEDVDGIIFCLINSNIVYSKNDCQNEKIKKSLMKKIKEQIKDINSDINSLKERIDLLVETKKEKKELLIRINKK